MDAATNSTALPGAATLAASLLESTIPGFGLISRLMNEYLHIDLSQYVGHLVIAVGLWTAGSYLFERAFDLFSEWFMATAEIRYTDEMYSYMMFWISRNAMTTRTLKFVAGTRTGRDWDDEDDSGDEDDDELEGGSEKDGDNKDGDDDDDDDDESGELSDAALRNMRISHRARPIKFTPMRQSSHYFFYRGHLVRFERVAEPSSGGSYWSSSREQLYLSSFGRSTKILKALLAEAQRAYLERDGSRTVIYRGGGGDDVDWRRCMARPPRPMSTVVLDEAQKTRVLADMKEYLHPRTKKWYSDRGIPYRRGYLLHGPPGTGKSSLCFALAGVLQLPIYVANLNSKSMNEDVLSNLFRDLPERSIVLLEDIDAAGLAVEKRGDAAGGNGGTQIQLDGVGGGDDDEDGFVPSQLKRSQTGMTISIPKEGPKNEVLNKGISFSGFLNIIDGVASAEGRILIMTTNHIEKLDNALLRPGRCDLIVHFTYASREMIRGLFLAIYSEKDIDERQEKNKNKNKNNGGKKSSTKRLRKPKKLRHGKTEEELEALAARFAEQLPGDELSPAEIQGYLLSNKTDPEAAVKGIDAWMAERALKATLKSY